MAAQGWVSGTERVSSSKWWLWPSCFLLFLMAAFPIAQRFLYLKAALFAALLILVVIQGVKRLHLHPAVVAWTLVLSAASLFFGVRGLILGAPGALKVVQIYAMWPLVYLLLLSGIRSIRTFQALEKTLLFSTIFVAVFLLVYVASELHVIPQIPGINSLFTRDELEGGFFLSATFRDGHAEIGFPGLHFYSFLVPCVIAALLDRWFNSSKLWKGRSWYVWALLISLPIVFLSGRRALQLVTLLAPFMTLGLGLFCPKQEKGLLLKSVSRSLVWLSACGALSFFLLSSVNLVTLEGVADRFSAGFDFSASNRSDSAVGRVDQYLAMMHAWEQAPYLGQGLGATAHECVRSPDFPWVYELSYVDLLFQTGVVGLILYGSGIAWICWLGIKIVKAGGEGARFMLPMLVALIAMLIASGTNPYLAGFDRLWVIFLPLAFINHWLLVQRGAFVSAKSRAQHS